MIRFVSPDVKRQFLLEKEDTYQLRNFFPSPCPIVGTRQRKTLFGRPGYCYVSPLIDEMHDIAQRVYNLTKAIRRRFVVDKEHEADLSLLISDADESEYIFIKNLMGIVEKGGIQNVIQALPVNDLSASLQELANIFEMYKQQFFEAYGVPDVLRGASDPLETAKAQEIKSFAATNRFRYQMNQIAGLARDTLELLIDLMLGAYPQEQIFKICGAEFMDELDQQKLPQAYQLIMNDEDRLIRIDIETDSTSYVNEQIEQNNRNVAIQTVTQGIQALQGLPPPALAIGFKTIMASLSGLRMGKDFMDDVDSLMQQMMEQAQQPQDPGPDVEMLKVQVQQAKVQQEGQNNALKQQIEGAKLVQQNQQMTIDQQVEQYKAYQKDQEIAIKAQTLQLETWNTQMMREFDAMRLRLEEMSTKISERLEDAELQIKAFSARMNATESAMEEVRLAKDQDLQTVGVIKEALTPPPEPESPVKMTINVPVKPQGKMTDE